MNIDFTKHSVAELRNMIQNSETLSDSLKQEGLTLIGKVKVVKFILQHMGSSETTEDEGENDNIEEHITPAIISSENVYSKVPALYDQNWEDYVLGLFGPTEIEENGYPLLPGLKRVATKLLGHPVFAGPIETEFSLNPVHHAKCVYELVFENIKVQGYNTGRTTFRSAADAWEQNTDQSFGKFPTTIAERRAEARAYRQALHLSIVSKEEITEKIKFGKEGEITKNQISVIKSLSRTLFNPSMCLAEYLYGKPLSRCTLDEGKALIKKINEFKSDLSLIPTDLQKNN